jgi:hypothetical protein
MAVTGVNLPYKNTMTSQVFSQNGNALNTEIGLGKKQEKSGDFRSFLSDQVEGFLKDAKDVEQKVTKFSEGKLDIEAVASEVATMGIKIEAAKRTVEEIKTGVHSLLNMQM